MPIGSCDCIRKKGNENYWNGFSCTPAVRFNKPCSNSSTNYMCKTLTEGTICEESGSSVLCRCPQHEFFNETSLKCEKQLMVDFDCYADDNCRGDLGLNCGINGTCQCDFNLLSTWNASLEACVSFSVCNKPCNDDIPCTGSLICRPSTIRTSCNCPFNVPVGSCDCPRSIGNESYFDGADCLPAKTIGGTCGSASKSYMCQH